MKLSQSSLALLEDTLKKAIGKYTCGCEQTIVTDIHLQPNQNSGELSIFDDEDEELANTSIEEWMTYEGDDFYENVERILSSLLCNMKNEGKFDKLTILKPFSFVLVDDDRETIAELLLMDDDILLDPEVLYRTYIFLSLLLPADQEAFLGGVMLTRDRPYWQVEFGARWNCGNIESLKGGYDVRQLSACLQNEKPEFADYQGWWYCAMPISVIRQDNLPLPLFVRMDDVEYGLRNMKQLILMNGICVWHEAFDKKYASSIFYYILRNQMIVNALYGLLPNRRTFLRQIFRHALGDMLLYRYDNVTMIVKGIQDYYKGPDWLVHVPAAKYNAQITKMGYRMQPLEQLEPLHLDAQFVPKQHLILKKLTLNGLFLPANHEAAVPLVHADFAVAFRARKLLHYDAAKTGGFVTKRSFWKAMQCFGKLGVLAVQTLLYAKKAQRAYLEQSDKFRTEAFWEQYLKENE